jgi:hypothetical protein
MSAADFAKRAATYVLLLLLGKIGSIDEQERRRDDRALWDICEEQDGAARQCLPRAARDGIGRGSCGWAKEPLGEEGIDGPGSPGRET